MKSDIIVIGGGASGMIAAVSAAQKGASVVILERMSRIGKKLLATGNGRCNYTNRKMNINCYHSQNIASVSKILNAFSEKDTEQFFMKLGILPKDKDGYVYPNSMQAASMLDALRFELDRLGVQVITDADVQKIARKGKGFQVTCREGDYQCRKVILAAGGRASEKLGSNGSGYSLARSLGHRIVPVVPALTGLKAKEKVYKNLSGVRTEGRVTLFIDNKAEDSHQGELQLADYGISGIPVFQISGQAAYGISGNRKVRCELDFFPEWTETELVSFLKERQKYFRNSPAEVFETGLLNRKLIRECIRLSGKTDRNGLPDMAVLAKTMKHFPATITESRGYEFAQVCAGGVDLSEIHLKSCESVKCSGLYIVGELLDADGICGGYNLQWAWSTGYLAGSHAGKECNASNRTN